ncbi:hypothetical protein [Candidatus Odyssella thessalonicensis]|uniref:hypothetical protein n=1 Tax=Candidatus Odyssella thessalonicensis TaxID=84647 RepID=UPI000225AF5F|nr:hypothetical protein [Candidatus Odyssella thessalonicensis]
MNKWVRCIALCLALATSLCAYENIEQELCEYIRTLSPYAPTWEEERKEHNFYKAKSLPEIVKLKSSFRLSRLAEYHRLQYQYFAKLVKQLQNSDAPNLKVIGNFLSEKLLYASHFLQASIINYMIDRFDEAAEPLAAKAFYFYRCELNQICHAIIHYTPVSPLSLNAPYNGWGEDS